MARRIRDSKLETRSARLRLAPHKKPYAGPLLARGLRQDYRRNQGAGSWVARGANGHGGYWTRALKGVVADDHEDADGIRVLNFWQAQDAIRKLASGKSGESGDRPATVHEALHAYERHLRVNGGDPYNAGRVRAHLSGAIAGKPVALLTARELQRWRDGLLAKGMTPASINRVNNGFAAALEQAAKLDLGITNHNAWRVGLAGLPDAHHARNVILSDTEVLQLVEACHVIDRQFGVLVEVLAQTGARISQAARLHVGDLQADGPDPRLLMPLSHKGGSRKKGHQRRPVPIKPALAVLLRQQAAGRDADAPLLVRSDGSAWGHSRKGRHRDVFRRAVVAAGLDPDITPYALRHSAIVRALLANVPIRLIAAQCDTSVAQIEASYSKFIASDARSDALSRAALLDTSAEPPADNVVPLARG